MSSSVLCDAIDLGRSSRTFGEFEGFFGKNRFDISYFQLDLRILVK
jgi:hypothetical protein